LGASFRFASCIAQLQGFCLLLDGELTRLGKFWLRKEVALLLLLPWLGECFLLVLIVAPAAILQAKVGGR